MPIQSTRGYDPSLTIDEQIADVTRQIEKRRQLALEPTRNALAAAREAVTTAQAAVAKSATPETTAALEAAVAEHTAAQAEFSKLEPLPLQALDGSTQANTLIQRLADLRAITQADADTNARMRAEESRERAKNLAGTVAQR